MEELNAHCDVPCGVYETDTMNHCVDTCRKLVKKLQELKPPAMDAPLAQRLEFLNFTARAVHTKEEFAERCKREALILWTDWFKQEHLAQFPQLHEAVWKAAKLCSQVKRTVDPAAVEQLQKAVDEISEMFAKTQAKK